MGHMAEEALLKWRLAYLLEKWLVKYLEKAAIEYAREERVK